MQDMTKKYQYLYDKKRCRREGKGVESYCSSWIKVLDRNDYLCGCNYVCLEDYWKRSGLCEIYHITDHMSLTRSKQSQGAKEATIFLRG
jgi:hypothetical protein